MIEAISTNPAERAINFIAQFREAGSGRDRRVRDNLASMYGLESSDTSSLMTVLSDAWKYPVQLNAAIESAGLPLIAYEHVIADLVRFLTVLQLDSHSNAVINSIPPSLNQFLVMLSPMLNKDAPEPLLSQTKIDDILKSLEILTKDIRSAKLDKEFTDNILHRAESIQYALKHYDTLGPDEVLARVEQMFGGILFQYSKMTNSPKKKGFTNTLLGLGVALATSLTIINGGYELKDNLNLSKILDSGINIKTEKIDINYPYIPDSNENKIA